MKLVPLCKFFGWIDLEAVADIDEEVCPSTRCEGCELIHTWRRESCSQWLAENSGRIARTIADMALARAEQSPQRFWQEIREVTINDRQRQVINLLIDDFYGKLSSSMWAKITRVSQDTAGRDIEDMIGKGLLRKDEFGGRSTSYSLYVPIRDL